MAKYSFDLKLKILQEYQQGKADIKTLANQHGIISYTSVQKWVAACQKFGEEGLRHNRQQMKYTVQFKQNAVELYLSSEKSYKDTDLSLGMTNPSLLASWGRWYHAAGIDGLKPQRKCRRPELKKPKAKEDMSSEQARCLEKLEEENIHLQIEIAFFKEVGRLRLAEEAQKRQQGLSTVSEEITD